MNIKDFKVGQTVYVELVGKASKGKTPDQCIEEWKVISVGEKYIRAGKKNRNSLLFIVLFEWRELYERFAEKTNFGVNYILYLTRQELEEKHEKIRLFREIEERLYRIPYDISLDQLRAIHGILVGGNKGE